jgi:hypothetical protein
MLAINENKHTVCHRFTSKKTISARGKTAGPSGFSDQAIGWEKTSQYKVGVDVSLFRRRVNLMSPAFFHSVGISSGIFLYLCPRILINI